MLKSAISDKSVPYTMEQLGQIATNCTIFNPHVEGKLVNGFKGLKVGQKLKARLTFINVESGYIDFERVQ